MTLGEQIVAFRARHNLSQEDFANMARLNVMTVNFIENGKHVPTKRTTQKIVMVLKEEGGNTNVDSKS